MHPRPEWLPPEVELMADVSEAEWVIGGLRPWALPVRVESFMPTTFESYVRVVHGRDPIDGSRMHAGMLGELVSLLSGSTDRDGPCWFCLWDGWGTWWKGAHSLLQARDGRRLSRRERRTLRQPACPEDRIDRERDAVLSQTPRVRTQHRDYFLFRGPLRAVHALSAISPGEPPNLWWPGDRSWLVSTEIDGHDTHIGGSAELVRAILASPGLNAIEVSVSDPLNPSGSEEGS